MARTQSFQGKDEICSGTVKSTDEAHSLLGDMGVGVACKKGLKPEAPNQDSYSIVVVGNRFKLYGVYDGHGPAGHDVSNFCRDTIPKLFLRNPTRECAPEKAMVDAFVECQKLLERTNEIESLHSGSTATLVYQPMNAAHLIVAHVGDSRAVLGEKIDGKVTHYNLTEDHKPENPAEKERIEKAGGRVVFDGYFNHRVYTRDGQGGLNMSRAIGDCIAKEAGVEASPDTDRVPIDVAKIELNKSAECFILVCSDGVWEFIESKEAVEICSKYSKNKAQDAAEDLSKIAWDRWMKDSDGQISDDITCICANFMEDGL